MTNPTILEIKQAVDSLQNFTEAELASRNILIVGDVADPSAGAGVAAPVGAYYFTRTTKKRWEKHDTADTAWRAADVAGISDAPSDGGQYVRKDGVWELVSIPPAGISDAPSNGTSYVRKDAAWTALPAPAIASDAPNDGNEYVRKNNAWSQITIPPAGISEAPIDGKKYARKDGGWIEDVDSAGTAVAIDWIDVAGPATISAAVNKGYICDSTGGAIVINLPTNAAEDDEITIDNVSTSANTITVSGQGTNILDQAQDLVLDVANVSYKFIRRTAGTMGWRVIASGIGLTASTPAPVGPVMPDLPGTDGVYELKRLAGLFSWSTPTPFVETPMVTTDQTILVPTNQPTINAAIDWIKGRLFLNGATATIRVEAAHSINYKILLNKVFLPHVFIETAADCQVTMPYVVSGFGGFFEINNSVFGGFKRASFNLNEPNNVGVSKHGILSFNSHILTFGVINDIMSSPVLADYVKLTGFYNAFIVTGGSVEGLGLNTDAINMSMLLRANVNFVKVIASSASFSLFSDSSNVSFNGLELTNAVDLLLVEATSGSNLSISVLDTDTSIKPADIRLSVGTGSKINIANASITGCVFSRYFAKANTSGEINIGSLTGTVTFKPDTTNQTLVDISNNGNVKITVSGDILLDSSTAAPNNFCYFGTGGGSFELNTVYSGSITALTETSQLTYLNSVVNSAPTSVGGNSTVKIVTSDVPNYKTITVTEGATINVGYNNNVIRLDTDNTYNVTIDLTRVNVIEGYEVTFTDVGTGGVNITWAGTTQAPAITSLTAGSACKIRNINGYWTRVA